MKVKYTSGWSCVYWTSGLCTIIWETWEILIKLYCTGNLDSKRWNEFCVNVTLQTQAIS